MIAVKNKNWFETTHNYRIRWEMAADGVIIQDGELNCPEIPPQEMVEIQLPIVKPQEIANEYLLKVIFMFQEATSWASAGFEIAWDQFTVPFTKMFLPTNETIQSGNLSIDHNEDSIQISGKDFTIEFNSRSGAWTRFFINGADYLSEPMLPNFWRVPIDNDGDALLVNFRLSKLITRMLLPWMRWKTAAKKRKVLKFEVEQPDRDRIHIHTTFKIPGGKTPLSLTYTIIGNGQVEVRYSFTPKKKLLRAGLLTQIPSANQKITWFGRGPEEFMLDRKSGYPVGIYELDIEDFIHNYVRPQENANRSDVRWARFTDENGRGIEIRSTSDHLFNFSAWPYTMEDLENADHIHELPRRETITLNIDYAQKGVGDLTSAIMGMPEDAQLLENEPCEFSFTIKAI